MPESCHICVLPVDDSLLPAMLELDVFPAQRGYVGNIANLLADAAVCPDAEPMAICCGTQPVGYYRIDPHPRSVAGRDFEVPTLGLRGFFVDARWQRLGLGTRALTALLADVSQRHPHARQLALTVDPDNHIARGVYLDAGFHDSTELYHGGGSRHSHLLLCKLP